MWIEIFKAGEFKDSKGNSQSYSCRNLDEIVRNYNETGQNNPAPIVIGHPESDSPALGWVERLARRGDKLVAKVKNLAQEFIKDFKEGRYRSVSVSLYPDLKLKHLGFLGAAQPAVKGLKPGFFSESDDEPLTITYDYAENDDNPEKLQELTQQNIELQNRLNDLTKEKRIEEFRNFAESQMNSGGICKLLPAQAKTLLDILTDVNQSSPDGALADKIMKFVAGLAPVANFSELNIKRIDNKFDLFNGKKVDESKLNLHIKTKEYLESHPGLSYLQALTLVKNSL